MEEEESVSREEYGGELLGSVGGPSHVRLSTMRKAAHGRPQNQHRGPGISRNMGIQTPEQRRVGLLPSLAWCWFRLCCEPGWRMGKKKMLTSLLVICLSEISSIWMYQFFFFWMYQCCKLSSATTIFLPLFSHPFHGLNFLLTRRALLLPNLL